MTLRTFYRLQVSWADQTPHPSYMLASGCFYIAPLTILFFLAKRIIVQMMRESNNIFYFSTFFDIFPKDSKSRSHRSDAAVLAFVYTFYLISFTCCFRRQTCRRLPYLSRPEREQSFRLPSCSRRKLISSKNLLQLILASFHPSCRCYNSYLYRYP